MRKAKAKDGRVRERRNKREKEGEEVKEWSGKYEE